jgi:hypothetical protein
LAGLEQLSVCCGARLALFRTWLGAGWEHLERLTCCALNGAADAEWLPLRRILQAVRLGVAAAMHLGVALRLNPHLVTGEQTEDPLLSWLRA